MDMFLKSTLRSPARSTRYHGILKLSEDLNFRQVRARRQCWIAKYCIMKARTQLNGELVDAGRNLRDGSSAIVCNKVREFLNNVPRSPQVLDSTNNGITCWFLSQLDSNVQGKAPGWGFMRKRALLSGAKCRLNSHEARLQGLYLA